MIDWTKGLTPKEIEFYKKMREEQQEAKKKEELDVKIVILN